MHKDKIKRYGVRIIIICLSMLFLCTFIVQKEGYHVDEVLSFQVGNSEFTPWIMPNQPRGRLAMFVQQHIEEDNPFLTVKNIGYFLKDALINRGSSAIETYRAEVYDTPVWMSREHYKTYLECDGEDAFNLLSVYYNAKDDIHPPLYYMLLHLVCSVFRGEITVWHGCLLNLAAVAVAMWLLGCIGDMLFQRRSSTIALMLLYGFSSGIIATTLWVRMYALLTLWLVWLLYLHIRKYTGYHKDSFLRISKKTGKARWIGSFGLLAAALCTFWTQYFGLFFLLPLAAGTCVLLLKDKRIRECFSYLRTMVSAGIIGLLGFPFAVSDVFDSAFGGHVLSQLENGVLEYFIRLKDFGAMLAENVAGSVGLFAVSFVIPLACLLYVRVRKKEGAGKAGWPLFLCVIPTVIFFLVTVKLSPNFVERYLMPVFPLAALLMVFAWERGLCGILREKRYDVVCLLAAVVILVVQIPDREWEQDYFHSGYGRQLAVAEEYAEYPMVCVYAGYSLYENVPEMQRYRESILVQEWELPLLGESHREPVQDGYVTVIKYPGEDKGEGKLKMVMNAFGGTNARLLGEWEAHGDVVYLVTP